MTNDTSAAARLAMVQANKERNDAYVVLLEAMQAMEYFLKRYDAIPPDDAGKLNVPEAHIHFRNAANQTQNAIAKCRAILEK